MILSPQSGSLKSGKLLAVMGPSGAGKSTFLDLISQRVQPSDQNASILFDGTADFKMRDIGSYVEQEDALIGVLTVHETVDYAARLSLPPSAPRPAISQLVSDTLTSLGLTSVRNNRIGTPIQRGVSGGEKRRVTIACSVVSRPKVLVLDEPTSGLDSTGGWGVVQSMKKLARKTNTIVIATIHQPNWETFSLFDEVLFLARGKCVYHGPISGVIPYFSQVGHPCPPHSNPADHVISLINVDFSHSVTTTSPPSEQEIEVRPTPDVPLTQPGALSQEDHERRVQYLADSWSERGAAFIASLPTPVEGEHGNTTGETAGSEELAERVLPMALSLRVESRGRGLGNALNLSVYRTGILMERSVLNYRRNLLAYGIRVGMYAGIGLLLATIWINLGTKDTKINDRLSVHFFSVAFLGFMSVAGIPSFLEERAVFVRERNNGLYGPGAYVIANSLVTIPFLFSCSVLFAVICYWAIGLRPGATAFFRFLSFLFLGVYNAEAQSVFVAAVIPIFVAALAIASFMNGFWMCVQGYFIRAVSLPRFWYYWAHWIDYQTFAFNLLVRNDLTGLVFQCTRLDNGGCQCSYPSSLVASGQCALTGEDVLDNLGIGGFSIGLYAGIMILIAVIYRVLFYVALLLRKR
ncbi:P-loop containing nucleoside triphosphate hydrolase protein [Cantharellus anzutake]|uniref:P-loop containing nucleoside triphosphate hydrolase protein n=1 Tax=Cantharellus anzutake TaxID=1750568 RepID=UPI0019088717|nr:P-loop containing nucleoside triphosphate hydrolase protein [Cantharellus anzutake]KAF8324153.1 P-loop containing nucleoside triphosphate hydrolase protein [Cantharellus anzutake]